MEHRVYYSSEADSPGHTPVYRLKDSDKRVELGKRLDLRNHSPDGFSWGYGGSGPAQLALAILADAVGDDYAQERHQEFKKAVVARYPDDRPFYVAVSTQRHDE